MQVSLLFERSPPPLRGDGITERVAYPKMRRIRYQIRLNAMQRAVLSVYWRESLSTGRQRVTASLARLTSEHGCRTPVNIPGRVALVNTCFASMHLPSRNCKVDQLDRSCDDEARPNVTCEHLYLRDNLHTCACMYSAVISQLTKQSSPYSANTNPSISAWHGFHCITKHNTTPQFSSSLLTWYLALWLSALGSTYTRRDLVNTPSSDSGW